MVLLKIADRKDFMSKLLAADSFDSFLLGEAIINTSNSIVIDGHINKDFFTKEEQADPAIVPYEYSEWKHSRQLCFDLIKGKRTPVSFQFVLYLKPEAMQKLLQNTISNLSDTPVRHMVLNIKFDQSGLSITSGIAYTSFTLDKQIDLLWDKTISKFLQQKEIAFEDMA